MSGVGLLSGDATNWVCNSISVINVVYYCIVTFYEERARVIKELSSNESTFVFTMQNLCTVCMFCRFFCFLFLVGLVFTLLLVLYCNSKRGVQAGDLHTYPFPYFGRNKESSCWLV